MKGQTAAKNKGREMTKEISLKAKIIYGVLAALVVVLLWLGDEGKQPIVYDGIELQHSVGLIDSENALVLRDSVARSGAVNCGSRAARSRPGPSIIWRRSWWLTLRFPRMPRSCNFVSITAGWARLR